jgi:hypothetical protein
LLQRRPVPNIQHYVDYNIASAQEAHTWKRTKPGNNGCHDDKDVKANTSQEEHGAVTMVAGKSSV